MLHPGLLARSAGTKLKLGRASWCESKPCAQCQMRLSPGPTVGLVHALLNS